MTSPKYQIPTPNHLGFGIWDLGLGFGIWDLGFVFAPSRSMRSKSLILGLSCLLFATGCDEKSPVGPTVPLNQQFTLAPGETASIEGTSVRIEFVGVSGDSRCPADAICIQGGDALVHVRVRNDGTAEYDLHTGDESRATVTHAGYRIALTELQPYPFSSRTIAPGEYRATLTVSR